MCNIQDNTSERYVKMQYTWVIRVHLIQVIYKYMRISHSAGRHCVILTMLSAYRREKINIYPMRNYSI